MTKQSVALLSGNIIKKLAIDAGISLRQVNDEAGLGVNYIYSILDSDRCQISTVNRIVGVFRSHGLNVSVADLLEETTVINTQRVAPIGITERQPLSLVA